MKKLIIKSDFVSRFRLCCPVFLLVICGLIIFTSEPVWSQESYTLNYFDSCNRVYKTNIKTVLFHREGWDMSPPLIRLNSEEKLRLSFDDLDAGKKEYLFTIVHCTSAWEPSELVQNEYIEGFFEDDITEFDFSFNTLIPYTHYNLIFPTEDVKPKISGNYILKLYDETPDSLVLTRRFMVLENLTDIEGKVSAASGIEDRNYKQEIDFTVKTRSMRIPNPFGDLNVIITQNGRWDNALRNIKPRMVVGDLLDYNFDGEIIFNGGNEFRSFDIKSLKYNSENILKIEKDVSEYQVFLRKGERRTFSVYRSQDDLDGLMKIKTEDNEITETEAEYIYVNFFLAYEAPFIDADVFILGQITDWRFSEESKMDYNFSRKGYEKTLLLKQGYYNYQYVLNSVNPSAGDETLIEGNHSETGNTYTVYIYFTGAGSLYDRLVGVKHFHSFDQ